MVMVDADGKRLEIIVLNRGYGPQQWIRVSWRGVLLGAGYYRTVDDALRFVDIESLVEVIPLPRARSLTTSRTSATRSCGNLLGVHLVVSLGYFPERQTRPIPRARRLPPRMVVQRHHSIMRVPVQPAYQSG